MAQTKRKRRTKHRGNAAGMVEVRGRTGRKPREEENKRSRQDDVRKRREDRLNRPPSWRGSLNRAAFAAIFFGILVILLFGRTVTEALPLIAFMLLLYIPLGYYTDLMIYRRRMKKLGRTP
jgi:Flp pilus assembly protein TadB